MSIIFRHVCLFFFILLIDRGQERTTTQTNCTLMTRIDLLYNCDAVLLGLRLFELT